jgi:pSer/pThr/pTyr-binding forkhead associated (FHA) protein
VSREHLRLRRDDLSGRFFLKDLSSLGTTVDGVPVPSSVEVVEGRKRDKGIEVPLPERARIGLANVIVLDFEAGGPRRDD